MQIQCAVTSGITYVACTLYEGDPSGDSIDVIAGLTYNNTAGTYLDGALAISVTHTDLQYRTIDFNDIPLTKGTQYYFQFYFINGGFGNLILRSASTGDATSTDNQVGKLYYANLIINNSTAYVSYNSDYPALYFRMYNLASIPENLSEGYELTNTSISYTFKVNSILEGINKCVELSPANWYWYVDQGTNEIQFKKKAEYIDHTFSFEKDIIDAKFEKRIEDIINVIYFSGGDTGGGSNFYKKYTVSDSIAKYGVKSTKYSDNRVTTVATADTIANSILEVKSEPELRVTLEILDNNNDMNMGYDIESIKVGDVIAVRNITQQVGLSTWDIGRWDEAYWDFNIYNLSSLQMQIQKLEYKQDSVVISASTIPLDVNKRVESINRSLEALQTLNNPTTPL